MYEMKRDDRICDECGYDIPEGVSYCGCGAALPKPMKPMTDEMTLIHGDCLVELKKLELNSIDACITDPPYELGFMGKSWDNTGIANNPELWKECLRVLKPGGHLLSFGGSRTYHRMACAIEDAGFEIRDQIMWVYGSGFPKSLNIGKVVDKLQGNERETIGYCERGNSVNTDFMSGNDITKGTSEWEGYGTALKPAHEPIVLARKPLSEKTIALNCLKWGVGGLAIDNCRVEAEKVTGARSSNKDGIARRKVYSGQWKEFEGNPTQGRFPANLIHDGSKEVTDLFPETNGGKFTQKKRQRNKGWCNSSLGEGVDAIDNYGDSGSAARFFYCAKASKSERNRGCEEIEMGKPVRWNKAGKWTNDTTPARNNHPTVKPIALMKYLVTLITREGQTVLDPFAGSFTTGMACKELGRKFIGIEKEIEYIEIAKKRIASTQKSMF